MVKRSLFGTSGIRGPSEELFTNQFCFDVGRTFAIFLAKNNQDGGVAIGLDPRGSSPRIKDAVASGLIYEGREVFDQGATSVPSMCYILKISDYYAGSVMVSGSHIKSDLNGVKFFAFDEEILKKHEREIEATYKETKERVKYKKGADFESHDELRAKSEYIEMLTKIADGPYPEWRVVVDPGDGVQSDTMPQVLKRLGVNVIEMNATIQGEFYARDTEHVPDMIDLINRVKKEKADFGIGYDADGDRVIFVDEHGDFIPGDYSACTIAKSEEGDSVVTTIGASQVADHIGKKVFRTEVGIPYVLSAMKKNKSNFGFEPNGGCVFPEISMTRDGGSTTVKLLNILKSKAKSMSKLIAELPKFYSFKDKVDYKWELQDNILKKARDEFKGTKTVDIDGLKVWLDKTTWILFRSSQNAPEFRIFAESDSKKKAKDLHKAGVALVKKSI